jgi:large subunit ribosomal protein L15
MKLNELKPAEGATRSRKRVGRGPGSGLGKTAGRGENGQKSRRGYSRQRGFEGGQMPLHRRLPKRGFTNIFAPVTKELTLSTISSNFGDGDTVSMETLREKKLIGAKVERVVVLLSGELTRSVTVQVGRVTKGAREAILAKGGTIVEPPPRKPNPAVKPAKTKSARPARPAAPADKKADAKPGAKS